MVKDCLNVRIQGNGNLQTPTSCPNSEFPKRKLFYALQARCQQENSPDITTGMLQLWYVNVYSLTYTGATIYFVTPLVDSKFDVLPNVLIQHFSVSTPMGDFVVA